MSVSVLVVATGDWRLARKGESWTPSHHDELVERLRAGVVWCGVVQLALLWCGAAGSAVERLHAWDGYW